MNSQIKKDLYRYIGDDCHSLKNQLRYILFTPGFTYIYFFRRCQFASNALSRAFFTVCLKLISFKYGIQIPSSTAIGEGWRIVHFGTIVVNPDAKIGKNFTIAQGCLIGNAQGKSTGVPTIGNNVCMHANSIIVGGVTIGDDVLVAPGAFVNMDVPSKCIVLGNPGTIIQRESSPTSKYIVYKVE